MRTFLIYLLICLSASGPATAGTTGTWKPVAKTEVMTGYRKAIDWFSQTGNYRVNISYASFIDHTSATAFDQSAGYYIRNGKNVHSCMMGTHTIQNDRLRFAVDTVNKIIVLNDAGDVGKSLMDMASFSELLDHAKSLLKQDAGNGKSSYRIEFKPNELYSAYEFELNEKGQLTRTRYFYSKDMAEENDEEIDSDAPVKKEQVKSKPRLEVSFSDYQTSFSPNYEKEFSEKKYLRLEGKKIITTEKYKEYQLKDYRLTAKK